MRETDAHMAVVFEKRTAEGNLGGPKNLSIGTLSGSGSGGNHVERWNSTESKDVDVCSNSSREAQVATWRGG